jgi:chromate reductase, NAD(P)H dehydrogenase (quinone)
MTDLSLLGIAGALRAGSTNRLLLAEARAAFRPASYQEGDLRLPLFDEDVESAEGIPPEVQRLADRIAGADAIVICTPEYNKALPGVLKNALDWVSRTDGAPFLGKPVAILSASEGRAGGERAQFSLRLCLTPFQPRLLSGPEVMIAHSRKAFDAEGRLSNPVSARLVSELMGLLRTEAETLARA